MSEWDDPLAEIAGMKRALIALMAAQGLQWDGAVLSKSRAMMVPIVVDHSFNAHSVRDESANG